MKRTILTLLFLTFLLGCTQPVAKEKSRIQIVTSFYPMYLFVSNIVKDIPGVQVVNLTDESAGGLHDYVFNPRDMKKIEKSDIFVINSYEHETFFSQIQQAYPLLKIIQASQGITPLQTTYFEKDAHDHADHHHGTIDIHFWVSPVLAMQQIEIIAVELSNFDKEYANLYIDNAQTYITQLSSLHKEMKEKMAAFTGRSVITYHDAFSYLFQDIGITLLATLQLEPGVVPTPQELKKLEDLIRENPKTPIFSEPQYSSILAENLAKATGASVYVLDPIVSGGTSLNTYQDIMQKNIQTLVMALEEK
ncbi:MAG: metal ABC transporter substrate-binding protein [Spirochaetia bacterium]